MRPALVAVLFVLACTACRREEPAIAASLICRGTRPT